MRDPKSEFTYAMRRARQEVDAALSATNEAAAKVHRILSERYALQARDLMELDAEPPARDNLSQVAPPEGQRIYQFERDIMFDTTTPSLSTPADVRRNDIRAVADALTAALPAVRALPRDKQLAPRSTARISETISCSSTIR